MASPHLNNMVEEIIAASRLLIIIPLPPRCAQLPNLWQTPENLICSQANPCSTIVVAMSFACAKHWATNLSLLTGFDFPSQGVPPPTRTQRTGLPCTTVANAALLSV